MGIYSIDRGRYNKLNQIPYSNAKTEDYENKFYDSIIETIRSSISEIDNYQNDNINGVKNLIITYKKEISLKVGIEFDPIKYKSKNFKNNIEKNNNESNLFKVSIDIIVTIDIVIEYQPINISDNKEDFDVFKITGTIRIGCIAELDVLYFLGIDGSYSLFWSLGIGFKSIYQFCSFIYNLMLFFIKSLYENLEEIKQDVKLLTEFLIPSIKITSTIWDIAGKLLNSNSNKQLTPEQIAYMTIRITIENTMNLHNQNPNNIKAKKFTDITYYKINKINANLYTIDIKFHNKYSYNSLPLIYQESIKSESNYSDYLCFNYRKIDLLNIYYTNGNKLSISGNISGKFKSKKLEASLSFIKNEEIISYSYKFDFYCWLNSKNSSLDSCITLIELEKKTIDSKEISLNLNNIYAKYYYHETKSKTTNNKKTEINHKIKLEFNNSTKQNDIKWVTYINQELSNIDDFVIENLGSEYKGIAKKIYNSITCVINEIQNKLSITKFKNNKGELIEINENKIDIELLIIKDYRQEYIIEGYKIISSIAIAKGLSIPTNIKGLNINIGGSVKSEYSVFLKSKNSQFNAAIFLILFSLIPNIPPNRVAFSVNLKCK